MKWYRSRYTREQKDRVLAVQKAYLAGLSPEKLERRKERLRNLRKKYRKRMTPKQKALLNASRSRWKKRNPGYTWSKKEITATAYRSNPANRERARIRAREYYHKNKARCSAQFKALYRRSRSKFLEYQKAYRKENGPKLREAARRRMASSPQFRMASTLRSRMRYALRSQGVKRRRGGRSFLQLVGCTPEQLMKHIESKFKPGMSWAQRRSFHIDHIEPCASFDLTDPKQMAACFHWSNLEPITPYENMKKGAKRMAQADLPLG